MQHNIYLYILVMAAVTYLIRVLPLTLIKKEIKNKTARSLSMMPHMLRISRSRMFRTQYTSVREQEPARSSCVRSQRMQDSPDFVWEPASCRTI